MGIVHKRQERMYSEKEKLEEKKRAIDSLKRARRELKRCLDGGLGSFYGRLAKLLLVATERQIAHLSFASYREEQWQIRHCEQEIHERLVESAISDRNTFEQEIGRSEARLQTFRGLSLEQQRKRGYGTLSFAKMTAERVSYWKERFEQHQANLANMLSGETYVLRAQYDSELQALVSKARVKAAHFAKLKGQHNAYLAHLWNLLATQGHTGSGSDCRKHYIKTALLHYELALLDGSISSMLDDAVLRWKYSVSSRGLLLGASSRIIHGQRYVAFVERIYKKFACRIDDLVESGAGAEDQGGSWELKVTIDVHVRRALLHVKLYEAYANWGDILFDW